MELKKILSPLLIFFMVISGVFSSTLPSENLDLWSSIKYGFTTGGLTIQGQEQACSVYPDDVRESVVFSSSSKRIASELAFDYKSLSDNGKVNIYAIQESGKWKFIKEIEYHERYFFVGSTKYALEFYNCPDKQQTKQSIYDYETSDGFKHGDLLCKGDYVAELNFNIDGQVSYNKILDCDKGCLGGVCLDEGEDVEEKQEVITHNSNGDQEFVWSDKQVSEEYQKVEEQLEGQNTDLKILQETLEKQREEQLQNGDVTSAQKTQDELDLLEKQIDSTNKEIDSLSQDSNYSFLFKF